MSFPRATSASTWQQPSAFFSIAPHLPQQCEPSSDFLLRVSSVFHTCIPTPLAFISTLLGFLSILSWLFAQLPQIIKNYRLRSTSGLSIYFLVEWCLGDLSNLLGAILTQQATWQVIVGAYYCSVDVVLVAQWTWFEGLGRGQPIKRKRRRTRQDAQPPKCDGEEYQYDARGMKQIADPLLKDGHEQQAQTARQIPYTTHHHDFFRTPNYGSIHSSSDNTAVSTTANSTPSTPPRRVMPRLQPSAFALPSPSPRTTLFLTLLVAIASTTTTAAAPSAAPAPGAPATRIPPLGTFLSWLSTALYLLSRLPQLLKNLSRRSTAGLSPLLFLAAFFGNLFYSTSLLCNPCLWSDLGPYGGRGWVGEAGSTQAEWATRALPFFLGAAVVLFMDAGVGVQFWLWGDGEEEEVPRERGIGEADCGGGGGGGRERRWSARTKGWMRGWVPSGRFGHMRVSLSSSSLSSATTMGREGEEEGLLGGAGASSSRL